MSEILRLSEKCSRATFLSRRYFLQALGFFGLGGGCVLTADLPLLARFNGFPQSGSLNSKPLFTVVPPSASGITWKHSNGRSPQYYLPETTGAGCAFLDYDNDGWMDIYLVNSGRCDFYDPSPPLRNALYRNNRDGTFTDVTDKAGVSGGGYGSHRTQVLEQI